MPLYADGNWEPDSAAAGTSRVGDLIHEILFGEGPDHWTDSLEDLKNASQTPEVWLGLEAFLARLQDWRLGVDPDEIRLMFSADSITLFSWLESFMEPSANWLQESIIAEADNQHVQAKPWLQSKAMVFDMDKIEVADLFTSNSNGQVVSDCSDPATASGNSVCRIFDLNDICLVEGPAS